MNRQFWKAALVGAALSFVLVPTLLMAKLAVTRAEPHAPIVPNLASIYALYGSVSVVIFVLVGLPLLAFYRRRGWRSWSAYCLGGAAVGIIGEVLLIVAGVGYWDTSNVDSLLSNTVMLAVCGFLTGAAFWSLTSERKPLRGSD